MNDARAKSSIDLLKLYMPIDDAAVGRHVDDVELDRLAEPSVGVKVMVTLPAPGTLKLVALYWSPWA